MALSAGTATCAQIQAPYVLCSSLDVGPHSGTETYTTEESLGGMWNHTLRSREGLTRFEAYTIRRAHFKKRMQSYKNKKFCVKVK